MAAEPTKQAEPSLDLFDSPSDATSQGGSESVEATAYAKSPATRDLLTFIALSMTRGMGHASLAALFRAYRPLHRVWEAGPDLVREIISNAKNRQADAVAHRLWAERSELMLRAEAIAEQYEKEQLRILFYERPDYPGALRDLDDAPRWLYVLGASELLHRRSSVAVVGTREPTTQGRLTARRAAHLLAVNGFVVISGLAEGVDQEVHSAVLQNGGETIAVLGHGLGVEYPAGSGTLRRRIVERGGAVVTEYLPNESYSRRSFVERNRIQAALAAAVIPVQGARKSGTAHTVRFAKELGRALVGVWNSRNMPTPENEMLDVLVEEGAKIYNLSTDEGVRGLLAELSPYASDTRPPKRDPLEVARRAYGGAIKALRDTLAERPPNVEEARWLMDLAFKAIRDARRERRPQPPGLDRQKLDSQEGE